MHRAPEVRGAQRIYLVAKDNECVLGATDQPDVRTESCCSGSAWGGGGETLLGWQWRGVPGARVRAGRPIWGAFTLSFPAGPRLHPSLCTAAALGPNATGWRGRGLSNSLAKLTLGRREETRLQRKRHVEKEGRQTELPPDSVCAVVHVLHCWQSAEQVSEES